MNEICKSKLTPAKAFWYILLYIFCAICFFNLTVAKINILACDILTLISICVGVYILYRYSVLSYRYILDDKKITILKIAGMNNEQIQAEIELENILSIEKYSQKIKGVLNYCISFKKNNAYVLNVKIDDKDFCLIIEPSSDFISELSKRMDMINEEI